MNDNSLYISRHIYKSAFKRLMLFCIALAAVRFSAGAFLFVMMAAGIVHAAQGKAGRALSIMVMMQFMIIVSPVLLPKTGGLFGIGARFGTLLVGLALASRGMVSKEKYRLPFGILLIYLCVAAISSASGWAPVISYMKLVNFLVFLIGIWFGVSGFDHNEIETQTIRATFIALAAFLILGSLAILPFPGVSTLNALAIASEETDVMVRNQILSEMIDSGSMTLFCGVTFQSQTLAPLLSCAFAWLLCDMLFIEECFRWPHVVMLLGALPLLYKTRSRVAFFCLVVIAAIVYLYLPRRIQMGMRMKKWLGGVLAGMAVLGVCIAACMEISDDAISKWIRKTDDVEGDTRSLQEAFTSSREGLIEMCMDDFKRNPILGMGFQVASYTTERLEGAKGLILSSPIEKGLLPVMVLGETGIVGFIAFGLFLICFFSSCSRKKLDITIGLTAVLLATNIGEATFFSPGGPGGIEWMFTIVGGYVLDMTLVAMRHRRNPMLIM